MELKVVLDKKEKLERDISDLILKFQDETTLSITDIEFYRPVPYTGGFDRPICIITVKVEI